MEPIQALIGCILPLQSSYLCDSSAIGPLTNSQNIILSLSAIHIIPICTCDLDTKELLLIFVRSVFVVYLVYSIWISYQWLWDVVPVAHCSNEPELSHLDLLNTWNRNVSLETDNGYTTFERSRHRHRVVERRCRNQHRTRDLATTAKVLRCCRRRAPQGAVTLWQLGGE